MGKHHESTDGQRPRPVVLCSLSFRMACAHARRPRVIHPMKELALSVLARQEQPSGVLVCAGFTEDHGFVAKANEWWVGIIIAFVEFQLIDGVGKHTNDDDRGLRLRIIWAALFCKI